MRVGYVVGGGGGAIRNYRTLRATAREPTSCRLRKGRRTCRTGGQAQGADHRHTVVYVHPFNFDYILDHDYAFVPTLNYPQPPPPLPKELTVWKHKYQV